jgi:hypothetical protein
MRNIGNYTSEKCLEEVKVNEPEYCHDYNSYGTIRLADQMRQDEIVEQINCCQPQKVVWNQKEN